MNLRFSSAKPHYLSTNALSSDVDSENTEKDKKHKKVFGQFRCFRSFDKGLLIARHHKRGDSCCKLCRAKG